jgi:hypothetical protein
MCGNDVLSEISSPSRKWKVVVFERSCGATTGFVKQAIVMRAGESLDDGVTGNIATSDGYGALKWTANDQLVVQYTGVLPATVTHNIKEVKVTYEQMP